MAYDPTCAPVTDFSGMQVNTYDNKWYPKKKPRKATAQLEALEGR